MLLREKGSHDRDESWTPLVSACRGKMDYLREGRCVSGAGRLVRRCAPFKQNIAWTKHRYPKHNPYRTPSSTPHLIRDSSMLRSRLQCDDTIAKSLRPGRRWFLITPLADGAYRLAARCTNSSGLRGESCLIHAPGVKLCWLSPGVCLISTLSLHAIRTTHMSILPVGQCGVKLPYLGLSTCDDVSWVRCC